MGYVERQITQGEKIVYRTSLHPVIFVRPFVFLIFGFVFRAIPDLLLIGTVIVALAFIALFDSLVRYKTSEFAVTDRRVIIKTGLIAKKTLETHQGRGGGCGSDGVWPYVQLWECHGDGYRRNQRTFQDDPVSDGFSKARSAGGSPNS